ncbi:MAG: hypothetical protein IPI46_01200 [Bacteroidetes bacterium]|nr:hypothetical protein [Bacteroidota bacterium]
MYTPEKHQTLLQECQQWHDELDACTARIHVMKNELYQFAPGKTDHDVMMGIEHFHNQFHIQLINVHDLSHKIKYHLREAKQHPELGPRVEHHRIKDDLDLLLGDCKTLDEEFHAFISKP